MKIAQVAPLYESVPPQLYGGTERVVAYICDALVELGHDVTLFAAGGAHTKARLVAMRDEAIRLDAAPLKSDVAAHLAMLNEVKRRASQFRPEAVIKKERGHLVQKRALFLRQPNASPQHGNPLLLR